MNHYEIFELCENDTLENLQLNNGNKIYCVLCKQNDDLFRVVNEKDFHLFESVSLNSWDHDLMIENEHMFKCWIYIAYENNSRQGEVEGYPRGKSYEQ